MARPHARPTKSPPAGFTVAEILVVSLLISIVLGTVLFATNRMFSGTKKGVDTLSVMQAEGIFLSYLKHDLRTLIISNDLSIPAPVITSDAKGTVSLRFYKVETADDQGRPYPIVVEYSRQDAPGKVRTRDGVEHPTFLIQRKLGTGPEKTFMKSMVSSFTIELLDRTGVVLSAPGMAKAQMARVTLKTHLNDLLMATACIYSPYLPSTIEGTLHECWNPNYRVNPTNPAANGATTYFGLYLDPADLEIIPGGGGIAIAEGMGF